MYFMGIQTFNQREKKFQHIVSLIFSCSVCRELWQLGKKALAGTRKMDVHMRLMKSYKSVPSWWFIALLVPTIVCIIFACEYYKESLQLPWWGVLLACGVALFFTLPIGIITATTNQVILNCNFLIATSSCSSPIFVGFMELIRQVSCASLVCARPRV